MVNAEEAPLNALWRLGHSHSYVRIQSPSNFDGRSGKRLSCPPSAAADHLSSVAFRLRPMYFPHLNAFKSNSTLTILHYLRSTTKYEEIHKSHFGTLVFRTFSVCGWEPRCVEGRLQTGRLTAGAVSGPAPPPRPPVLVTGQPGQG